MKDQKDHPDCYQLFCCTVLKMVGMLLASTAKVMSTSVMAALVCKKILRDIQATSAGFKNIFSRSFHTFVTKTMQNPILHTFYKAVSEEEEGVSLDWSACSPDIFQQRIHVVAYLE